MDKSTPTMRVTRGRTGKLPTPATRKDFVSEFEEEGSPPPSPSRKRTPKAEKESVDIQEVHEVVPVKKSGPVFETFKSNKKLEDGLCVVRALGGGRYEIVSLKSIDQQHFSSEETGAIIKADEGRRNILDVDEKEWEAAKFNCGQAVRSADKSIFRIRKLPIELRLIIYGFAMVGSKPLHSDRGAITPNLALAPLMQICKEMLEETRPIFYKNSFRIDLCDKIPGDHLMIIKPHLREVTFTWDTYGRKEVNAIKFFHTCPNLKVLNLRVNGYLSNPRIGHRHQWRHQHVESIKKFSRCHGFDDIVGLKGFEKVRVEDDGSDFSAAEIKAFQDFLTPLLTTPKYVPPPKPEKVVKAAKTKKSRKSKKVTNWEDDSDYDG